MFKRTNFNSPFRPSLFFLKKRLRFQIQEQALITFAAFATFYVNFLSSRKYDWNVAPKDLEKYGAPTAHASYFFKKKLKFIYFNYYY